jgi:hypothetical protein
MQWIGKARLLRGRIASAHRAWLDGAVDLAAPLMPRDNFTPTFTQQSLSVTAARWKSLPEWGRLGSSVAREPDRLLISETRLASFTVTMAEWDDPELSVAVTLSALDMRLPAAFSTCIRVIAAVGLHGIARRFERGSDRSERAVLRDFMPISAAWPDAVRSGRDFDVPALGGGRWIGAVMVHEKRPTLAVRTFVNP